MVYPKSLILSVEPDLGNCRIAKKNLPENAKLHTAAISSQRGTGRLVATGRNVGFRVEQDFNGPVKFVTVEDLLEATKDCVPFLIKIDIEGFESDLFAENTDWIDFFPVVLIELHDWMLPKKHVSLNFLKEISKRNRDFIHFDGYIASIASDLSTFKVM